MGNDANPKQLTASATTTLNSCFLYGISINKTLTGTLTVKESGTAVATFAIGTGPGMFFMHMNGIRFSVLTIVLSAADDATAFIRAV